MQKSTPLQVMALVHHLYDSDLISFLANTAEKSLYVQPRLAVQEKIMIVIFSGGRDGLPTPT